jgi:hypothetical protein
VREDIPNTDSVSRLIFFPRMYRQDLDLIWESIFEFPGGVGESVVWHRHAPTGEAIRTIGCDMQSTKRAAKPDTTYVGHVVAAKGAICGVRNARGNGFTVEHVPDVDGQVVLHHAEIRYALAEGCEYKTLSKPEKADLKLTLGQAFSPRQPQSCD